MAGKTDFSYEVLSPWAEADPVPFRGISPRLNDLNGKKIGLFRNSKRAAEPALRVIENRLRQRFPSATFSWFANDFRNEMVTETPAKNDFEAWAKGVDGIITAYGD